MKKRKNLFLVMLLVLSISLVACGNNEEGVKNKNDLKVKSEKINDDTEWFTTYDSIDLEGNKVDKTVFAEKDITLINTWATWCGPCVSEIKHLGNLAKDKDLENVGIKGLLVEMDDSSPNILAGISDDEKKVAKSILEKSNADYQQLLVSEELLDTKFTKIMAFPTTYFVDSEGKFVGRPVEGPRDEEGWRKIIEERLKMIEND